jgi:Tol biopolymer transport system component
VLRQDFSVITFWTALSWSPDGNYIAFAGAQGPSREILLIASAGGGTLQRLGAAGVQGWSPAWAPR